MAFGREPCPKCGSNISMILWGAIMGEREAYCSGCGVKLTTKCEKCGTLLMVGERFCSHCGNKNPIFIEKT